MIFKEKKILQNQSLSKVSLKNRRISEEHEERKEVAVQVLAVFQKLLFDLVPSSKGRSIPFVNIKSLRPLKRIIIEGRNHRILFSLYKKIHRDYNLVRLINKS